MNEQQTIKQMEGLALEAFNYYKTNGELPYLRAAKILFDFLDERFLIMYSEKEKTCLCNPLYDINKMKIKFYFDYLILENKELQF